MTDQVAVLNPPNLRELLLRQEFQRDRQLNPEIHHPFWAPCRNRVLIVADGALDFSESDFGLNVFVRTLLDMPGRHVRHVVTLAHLSAVGPNRLMAGESRIARRIPSFTFDNRDQFASDMYDVVMLFGFDPRFSSRGSGKDPFPAASDGRPYPNDRLADPELEALTMYMNGGGGLFATGDHGSLGYAMNHAVPRARNMRLWTSTANQSHTDQVSMTGEYRNDTNRGGYFDSQSDDRPQIIEPKMYPASSVFHLTFPHPLLCGPKGVIRVMPDHPHEGECVEPADLDMQLDFGGGPEYPAAAGGSRPVPEIISTNTVPSGNRSEYSSGGSKSPTVAQCFGGICAYDGHRAGVGRVVTDATWHHFVNVNFVGIAGPAAPPFDIGFLTPAGEPAFEAIKAYHRNLVVWTTRVDRIRCMNLRLIWDALWSDRVMEAVLTRTKVSVRELRPDTLRHIGGHARDVLGRVAGRCLVFDLVLKLVLERAVPELVPHIDPWVGGDDPGERLEMAWFDASPLLDVALGGALVAIREVYGEPSEDNVADLDIDRLAEVVTEGGSLAVRLGIESMRDELEVVRERLEI